MFTIDQNMTYEKIRRKNLVKAFFSMNNHQVATPEMMLEEARSYILFFREPGEKLSAYIGLHLLATGRKLFYSHSSNSFFDDEMKSIEEEGLIFVEGLGALLDEKDFTNLTSAEKTQWMEKQEIFLEKPEPESPTEETPAEETLQESRPAPQEPQASQPPPVASGPQVEPQQPVQPVQYQPQPSQQPYPQQAQPVAFEQQTFETQRQQASGPPLRREPDIRETPSPAPKKAKPATGQTAPPLEAEEMREPGGVEAGTKTASRGPSARGRQEIMQKAIRAGVVKAPKQSLKKEGQAAAGIVSRDREALARLLTSF